jgi:hypothetical protein
MCLCVRPYGHTASVRGDRKSHSNDTGQANPCHSQSGHPLLSGQQQDTARLLVDRIQQETGAPVPDLMTDNRGLTYSAIRNSELERFSEK